MKLSQTEIATLLGCDVRTLRRWESEDPPLPRQRDGSYDAPACVGWLVDREVRNAAADDGDAELTAAKVRKEAALAELREYELAEKRRTMIQIDDVEEGLRDVLGRVRAAILVMPTRCAHRLAHFGLSMRDATKLLTDIAQNDIMPALRALANDPSLKYENDDDSHDQGRSERADPATDRGVSPPVGSEGAAGARKAGAGAPGAARPRDAGGSRADAARRREPRTARAAGARRSHPGGADGAGGGE